MIWRAPSEVQDLILKVKAEHHSPRLDQGTLAVCFDDSKPYVKNRINLGKLAKFTSIAKLYQRDRFDFVLTVPSDLWSEVLTDERRREAYFDLQLSRCDMEYIPEVIEENGKKVKVADESGHVKMTNEPKYDAEGNPKWKILPLDLTTFFGNVRRYGIWLDELEMLNEAFHLHA